MDAERARIRAILEHLTDCQSLFVFGEVTEPFVFKINNYGYGYLVNDELCFTESINLAKYIKLHVPEISRIVLNTF